MQTIDESERGLPVFQASKMAKTKKDLEEAIEQLEEEVQKLRKKNHEYAENAETAYKNSGEYSHLMAVQDYYKSFSESAILAACVKRQKKITAEKSYQELLKDNTELCKKHNVEYWIGLAQMWQYSDTYWLKNKIDELEAKVEVQKAVIEHLKQYIGKTPQEQENQAAILSASAKKKPVGRPRIDPQTKRRIRKMYPEYSIRQISEIEGVSVGSVANIVKNKK